jgi:hypothetical protein
MNTTPIATISAKYRLVDRITESGQGEVWLALDSDGIQVSVKLLPLPARLVDQERVRARFRDEVEVGQVLQAPSICRLVDAGELESLPELHRWHGVFYIVHEYIEGGSLEDFIEAEAEFSLDDLRCFVKTICDALSVAHGGERCLVHQNIRPANILLAGGALRCPKLANFNLASSSNPARLTATGSSVIASLYTAPEQILSSADVAPATDQYSLALVLCDLLTGDVPGVANDLYSSLVLRQTGVDAPPFEIEDEESPNIRAVIQRALSPDPTNRFPTINEFAAAFDAAGVEDRWWDEVEDADDGIYLDEMEFFVLDKRKIGGSLWVGGRAANTATLQQLFGASQWSFEEESAELDGAAGYRLHGQATMPWRGSQAVDGIVNEVNRTSGSRPIVRGKRVRDGSVAFMKPLIASPALAAIIGAKPLPRTEVVIRLWAYIKRNGLQDQKNKRMIHADELLLPIFNGRSQVSMFDMTKYVSQHLS